MGSQGDLEVGGDAAGRPANLCEPGKWLQSRESGAHRSPVFWEFQKLVEGFANPCTPCRRSLREHARQGLGKKEASLDSWGVLSFQHLGFLRGLVHLSALTARGPRRTPAPLSCPSQAWHRALACFTEVPLLVASAHRHPWASPRLLAQRSGPNYARLPVAPTTQQPGVMRDSARAGSPMREHGCRAFDWGPAGDVAPARGSMTAGTSGP